MQIHIFGEDSQNKGSIFLQNIILKSLYYVEPNFDSDHNDFTIISTNSFRLTLQGNNWRTKKPTANFMELCRLIADVYESDEQFIFWHIDADTTWNTQPDPYLTSNILQFEDTILKKVEALCKKKKYDRTALYNKLILLVPYYSIESWLYENYSVVENSHKHCHDELKSFKRKHGDTFDTIDKIKEKTDTKDCINPELSENFPSKRVQKIGMSYALFLKILDQNTDLKDAIPKRKYEI